MKTTFVAEAAGIAAHFIVNEQIMQAFINHLNPYFPNKLHKLMLLTYNKAA
jgi:hypothetical protein